LRIWLSKDVPERGHPKIKIGRSEFFEEVIDFESLFIG
jgi:hypothetical protein